jgi:excisionase family DNA binding protein
LSGRSLRILGSREELAELSQLADHRHDELLTVPQAAERLNISPTTAYYLAARGELPVVRFPGSRIVRVSGKALARLIELQVDAFFRRSAGQSPPHDDRPAR